jgi:peptidylprolyl isomerase
MTAFETLEIEDLKLGSGAIVKKGGALITAHYKGMFPDGSVFDSSYDRNTPFKTVLSRKKVIAAWVDGLIGMQEGGIRRLNVPAALAYAERGFGNTIPPHADLVFEIALIEVLNRE